MIKLFEEFFSDKTNSITEAKKQKLTISKKTGFVDEQTVDVTYFNGDTATETISITSASINELLAYLRDYSTSKSASSLTISYKKYPILTLFKKDGWLLNPANISKEFDSGVKQLKPVMRTFSSDLQMSEKLNRFSYKQLANWKGLNVNFFKTWSTTTPSQVAEDDVNNEYDNVAVSDWSVDMFTSYLFDSACDYKGNIIDSDVAKLLNLKVGDNIYMFDYYPSNYNENIEWNKYNTTNAALYDCFKYLLTTI